MCVYLYVHNIYIHSTHTYIMYPKTFILDESLPSTTLYYIYSTTHYYISTVYMYILYVCICIYIYIYAISITDTKHLELYTNIFYMYDLTD